MKLNVSKRAGKSKSELTQLRFKGDIPAVVYKMGQPSEKLTVKGSEFAAVIRGLKKGYLPTTIFEIEIDGKECPSIVKGIQYHPTTYRTLHLDFQLLDEKIMVDVKVPVTFLGEAECIGVKLGGFVRQVIYHVKVRCLPKDIPSDFKLDIRSLAIGESMRVGDIEMSEGVISLVPEKEIIIVIAKR
ncbi:MAG: 50S ribosomal protein L25 [Chlamydiae bacterium]|nr:50S ribosomal protein L25 [Chlamydiota bacterium]